MVLHEEIEYSPYISKKSMNTVPRQANLNLMPEYLEGETEEDIRKSGGKYFLHK